MSTNRDNFISCFSISRSFISFSCYIAVVRAFSIMVERVMLYTFIIGENQFLCVSTKN